MGYALEPITEDFFTTAPVTYAIDVNLPVAPAQAWSEFTRQNTLDWCRALKSVTFTSPAPYEVGTTRTAVLAQGLVKINELFFVWEENPATETFRHAFHGVEVNVPGLRKFGEYTEVSPAAHGSRLIWRFAMELSGPALPGFISTPVANAAFSTVRNDTVRHFATF